MIRTDINNNETTEASRIAMLEEEKRANRIRKFYKSLTSWVTTSIFMVAIDLFTSQSISWSKWPVFFWGIALLFQLIPILRLQDLDKSWEERRIRKRGGLVLPDPEDQRQEDFSEELLQNQEEAQKEKADLSEFRTLRKPWRDEDLV